MVAAAVIGLAVLIWLALRWQPAGKKRTDPALIMALGLGALGLLLLATGKLPLSLPALGGAAVAFMRYRGLFSLFVGRRPNRSQPPPPGGIVRCDMDADEARAILGLAEQASADEVRAAHRRLIQQLHPDQGGSDYLAAKINRAKDVLLGKP